MENISEHITYAEAVHSDTAKRLGINNVPTEEHLKCMRLLADKVFEPLRRHFGVPIYVSSFFRSAALNVAIAGAANSQHMLGEAMDIDSEMFGKVTNKQIFEFIRDNLQFDQLLWEFGTDVEPDWVHVSYTEKRPNRNQVLTIKK
jgi:zinc D-Ala-D-Ala carboxypeptidase